MSKKPSVSRGHENWTSEFSWLSIDRDSAQGSCTKCKMTFNGRLSRTFLLRHEHSQNHSGGDVGTAPAVTEFQDCIERRKKKESFRASPQGRSKEWRLAWCLGEAYREDVRSRLSTVVSSTVSQDAQGQLLSVRFFSTVESSGEDPSVKGILAFVNEWGAGSTDLSLAVRGSTRRLFTHYLKPPSGWQGPAPVIYKKGFQKFCKSVHFLAADAAEDETKAIRILSGKDQACHDGRVKSAGLFPSVCARVRDNAHAAGRLTKKWKANDFLWNVFQKYVRGKASVTALIWHSADNKRLFQKHVPSLIFQNLFI